MGFRRNGDSGWSGSLPTVYTFPRNVAVGIVVLFVALGLASLAHAVTLEVRVQKMESEIEELENRMDRHRAAMERVRGQ